MNLGNNHKILLVIMVGVAEKIEAVSRNMGCGISGNDC